MTAQNLTAHPAAEIFPLLSEPEFQQLKADIKTHGLSQAIVLAEGQILDGRNRHRACLELGLEPRFEKYEGDDPVAFVIGRNMIRRHLGTSQRAIIAATVAKTKHGGDRTKPQFCGLSHAQVATQFNVSLRLVEKAAALRNAVKAGKVDAAVVKAVEDGKLTVNAAYKKLKLSENQAHQSVNTPGPVVPVRQLLRSPDTVFSYVDRLCTQLADFADMAKAILTEEDMRRIVDGCRRGAEQL